MDERYHKFNVSKQEALRLTIALEEFFRDGTDGEAREAYGRYLRQRLLPAGTALVELDDTDRLAQLAEQGWFTAKLTDGLIRCARERQKTAALVWLLRWKGEKYGFPDKDFSL